MKIEYVITVDYPPNATKKDFEEHLGELEDTISKYGLGVDGSYEVVE